jgi:hypothetical protein
MSDPMRAGGNRPVLNNPLVNVGGQNAVQDAQQPPINPRDYKPSKNILSSNELITAMGAPPKDNVTIGVLTIKSHSVAYKAALGSLQSFNSELSQLKDTPLSNVQPADIQKLKTALQDVVNQADAYHAKHATADGKRARRDVMTEVKAAALKEMAALDDLGKLTNHADKNVTMGEGLAMVRAGVTDATQFSRALSDDRIDAARSRDNFGAGAVNTVSLIAYGNDMRVVKPLAKEADNLKPGERLVDMDPHDLKIAARNMNSAATARVLQMPGLIPQPHIAIHHDEAVLAMPLAKGECFVEKSTGAPQFRDVGLGGTTDPALKASVFKGLLDLQALDCINAQVDRQPENYFINVLPGNRAQITGIDNDMSGGAQLTTIEIQPNQDVRLKATYGGPPPLMSREFFDKLAQTSENAIRQAMSPGTPQTHVDAQVSRFRDLKQHALQLEKDGCIVDNFETWTHKDPKSDQIVGAEDYLKNSDYRSYPKRMYATLDKIAARGVQPLDMNPAKHG